MHIHWLLSRNNRSVIAFLVLSISVLGIDSAVRKPQTGIALLRKLLRGYEKLPPPGGPTLVRLGIYINYFYAMSEQSMDYRLSFYLRQNWTDTRFVFNPKEHSNIARLRLDDEWIKYLWLPDVFFRNLKDAAFHTVTQKNRLLYIYPDGNIWYVSKISATFSCPMKLQKYPMDKQSCPLQFESFGYTTDTIIYDWLETGSIQFDPIGKELPEMELGEPETNICTFNETSDYQPGEYPCLVAHFPATRRLGYFITQFYVPTILLVILSWVSFWISVDAVVARVSIGLLTVLNVVFQSTGSREQLPKVSYIKAIDVWMTACLVFAFASLIEFAIVNVWSRTATRNKKPPPQPKDAAGGGTGGKGTGTGTGGTGTGGGGTARTGTGEGGTAGKGEAAGGTGTGGGTGGEVTQGVTTTGPQMGKHEEIPLKQVALQVSDRGPGRRTRRLSDISNILAQPLLSIHQHRAQTLDQLARKLFPGSFLLFSIMYWVAYTAIISD